MPDPLAETAARLRALVPAFPDTYDVVLGEVSGPGWVRLDAAPVARWCAEARERGNPRRLASVAAAAVGGALAHAVLARVTAALAVDGRAWDLGADALTVHRAPEGHLDRVAVRPPAWVVAGDPAAPAAPQTSTSVPPVSPAAPSPAAPSPAAPSPAAPSPAAPSPDAPSPAAPSPAPAPRAVAARVAGRAVAGRAVAGALPRGAAAVAPDALVRVFPDEAALLDAVAAAAVATLAPLLDEVRAATRFGLVPLWNAAGDAVRLTAAMVPRYAGRTPRPGLATALLDALVAHGAPIRGRGTDQPLAGRAERVPVRAACCLAYRTDPPVADPADALCTTCPLLDPPERARRYAAWLMRVAPAGR